MGLFHATLTDFEPPEKTILNIKKNSGNEFITSPTLSFLNWNIGFAGMGENQISSMTVIKVFSF